MPVLIFYDLNEELVDDANKRNYKQTEVPLGRGAKSQEVLKWPFFPQKMPVTLQEH
jgi:hypothetical protein